MPGPDLSRLDSVRNDSEFPVPNGSQSKAGRPAVVSDEQLALLASRLNDRLGRPPRADELIIEAGGCQRKRALAAIRQLKLDLSQRAVHSQLVFPASIERSIRSLIAQWIQHASEQLAAAHLEHSERTDICQNAQRSLIEEQQESIAGLRQQLADRERVTAEFGRRIRDLESDLAAAREECIRVNSIAAERMRLLIEFKSPNDALHGATQDHKVAEVAHA